MTARPEILKLARLLGRDPDALSYLNEVADDDLRQLRELVTERLFSAQGQTLSRLAAASKLLPTGLVATLGERTFGPLLSARIAGLLEPSRAVDLAGKLPTPFLADVAIELDPRRASEVIGRVPARRVADVAAELGRRGEYVTLGRFVGHVGDDALRAAMAVLSDRDVLQVAFVMEQKDRLEELADLLGPQRLRSLIDTAGREGLEVQGRDLLDHVSAERRHEISDVAVALGYPEP